MAADQAERRLPSPLAMGAGQRLALLGAFLAGLWLAVAWAAGLLS